MKNLPMVIPQPQPQIQLRSPYGNGIRISPMFIMLAACDPRVSDEQFMHICQVTARNLCEPNNT